MMMNRISALLLSVCLPLLLLPSCRKGNMSEHDFTGRISICRSVQIAGFNGETEGWQGTEGSRVTLADGLEVMKPEETLEDYGIGLGEGENSLLVRAGDMPANIWRGAGKTFSAPLDFGDRTILQFMLFAPEDRPGERIYVRAVLGDGRRKYEVRSEVIPAMWAVPIFDVSGCPFLHRVRTLDIEIMNGSARTWKNCRFLLDDVRIGEPLDWSFTVKGFSRRFTAENGGISEGRGKLRFRFGESGRLSTTDDLTGSRNMTFNPPLDSFNTLHIVMANRSSAKKLKLKFTTDLHDTFCDEASKEFDILPQTGPTAYFFNLSDRPSAEGFLTGLSMEPEEAASGEWDICKMTFLREAPIETYAGEISECRSEGGHLVIKGKINGQYAGEGAVLRIYEAPMYKIDGPLDPGALEGLELLHEEPAAKEFEINSIPDRRLDGKMSRLAMRMLAVVCNEDGGAVKIAPYFFIENWRDFADNPWEFSLPGRKFSVLDFGAKGDGFTDDTRAINRAIAKCSSSGGGQVVIPGGRMPGCDASVGRRYIVTNIVMKDNVDLHIEKDAVLWQSGDVTNYGYDLRFTHNQNIPGVPWAHTIFFNRPLIEVLNVSNVKITGEGAILMSNPFTYNPKFNHTYSCCTDKIHVVPIGANGVRNMEVSDVSIVCSPSYFTKFQFVSNLFIGNVSMLRPACSSGDGIGLTSCENVRIARAVYWSNDDGVTLVSSYGDPRGDASPWRQFPAGADHSLRNVTITGSYIDCLYPSRIFGHQLGNVVESHAIAFIPWGKTREDQSLQVIDGIQAHDNILRGGWSVGVWPDTPFDGKPFTNDERDDYSPVMNVDIHDNEYLSRCGFLWVVPENFTGDTGI